MLIAGARINPLRAQEQAGTFDQLIFPPLGAVDRPDVYGYKKASQDQIDRTNKVISDTPRGPAPIDVAQSFIDRFYDKEPELVAQWPAPASWNPLVVHFFNDATRLKVNNDMINWCAAFVNWCIVWAGRRGSDDASSQSFLRKSFVRVPTPERGDLAIFTCYDPTGKSMGLGHVGFVKERPADPATVVLIGGNTSKDGHSSIICEKPFATGPRLARRNVNGRLVPCTFRLNAYARVS